MTPTPEDVANFSRGNISDEAKFMRALGHIRTADMLEALAAQLAEVEATLQAMTGTALDGLTSAAQAANGWDHWMRRAEAAEARVTALTDELAEARRRQGGSTGGGTGC
jgi:hypothetical protein